MLGDLAFTYKINTSTLWRVLTMVYNTRDYWVFGLCPPSGILRNTNEHSVSETGSVSETLRSLAFFITPDDGQGQKNSNPKINTEWHFMNWNISHYFHTITTDFIFPHVQFDCFHTLTLTCTLFWVMTNETNESFPSHCAHTVQHFLSVHSIEFHPPVVY
jgi:hypothetical protein